MSGRRPLLACILLGAVLAVFPAVGQERYSNTISVMQTALRGELIAHARYEAYAEKAREDKYPRLAYFSVALGVSESVHARNFQSVLTALGVMPDLTVPEISIGDTQTNLRNACSVEMEEIDNRYPQYLRKITPEGYPQAIDTLTYAWEGEKLHRDLVKKLIAGSGVLFGLLVKTFEETPVEYYVCQSCGSAVVGADLPSDTCPICAAPASQYRKVDPGE